MNWICPHTECVIAGCPANCLFKDQKPKPERRADKP